MVDDQSFKLLGLSLIQLKKRSVPRQLSTTTMVSSNTLIPNWYTANATIGSR